MSYTSLVRHSISGLIRYERSDTGAERRAVVERRRGRRHATRNKTQPQTKRSVEFVHFEFGSFRFQSIKRFQRYAGVANG